MPRLYPSHTRTWFSRISRRLSDPATPLSSSGRRRRSLRVGIVLGLACVLAPASGARAATGYTATELGMQSSRDAAGALNSFGQVTGYFYPSGSVDGDMHAFLYSAGSGVVDLGTLGGSSSRGHAINNSGQVVGESRTSGGAAHAFTYSAAGGMVDLGTPSNIRSMAFSVNDSGQVAGSYGARFLHAFVHTAAGGMVDLGTLGGRNSSAVAQNNAGQVVGKSSTSEGYTHAFVHTATAGMVDLGTLGGSYSEAAAINSTGLVTGYSNVSGDGSFHAFVYSAAGGMVDLGTLGGTNSQAVALNDAGQVVGSASILGDAVHAFVYTAAGGMVDLGTLGGGNSYGTAINSSGQVAGSSNISGNSATHAFVYTAGGGMVDLNTVTSGLDGYLDRALAINDRGMILAGGYRGDGSYFLYLLAPSVNGQQMVQDGLQTAALQDQALLGTIQNALGDINGRLFMLRAGDGEEAGAGSIASAVDDGVIMGQGDGPEGGPLARQVLRSRQWEVYTTVNYANISLSGIGTQAGMDSQTWSPSVGIERHVTRGLSLGFAASFINARQTYASSLGTLDIEGLALSAYASYVRKSFWVDALYSFGMLDLDSTRNPGAGLPAANGDTTAHTNLVQFNTGWNFRFMDNTFVTGPFIGLDYTNVAVDAYTETGGGIAALSYGSRSIDSLISRVGWSASKKIHTSWATITPQLRLSYERQNITSNNATSASLVNLPFAATTQGQSPGQDYMVIGAGMNFQFNDFCSLMLSYSTQMFRQDMQAHFGGMRLSVRF